MSGPSRHFLVYNVDTGEILSKKQYHSSKEALTDYALKHNNPDVNINDVQAIKWWGEHKDIWNSIDEIHYEEKIIKQKILNYQVFRLSMLKSSYGDRIPLRTLWHYYPKTLK